MNPFGDVTFGKFKIYFLQHKKKQVPKQRLEGKREGCTHIVVRFFYIFVIIFKYSNALRAACDWASLVVAPDP